MLSGLLTIGSSKSEGSYWAGVSDTSNDDIAQHQVTTIHNHSRFVEQIARQGVLTIYVLSPRGSIVVIKIVVTLPSEQDLRGTRTKRTFIASVLLLRI